MYQQKQLPAVSLWSAVFRVVIFAILFLVCVRIGGILVGSLVVDALSNIRSRTALAICGSLLGQLIAGGILLAWVLGTGRGLRWLGLKTPAPAKAWVLAAGVALLWVFLVWNGVLAQVDGFGELSVWRISLALGAGLIGGTCEELVFRGAVIQTLSDSDAPRWSQFAAGSLTFGMAHLGWAALNGNLATGIAAAIFTTILGAALSFLFLWGGRSLWPSIAAHASINLAIEPWLVFAMMQR
jgi:membrane protease YdiL (CAAX protease family)